MYNITLTMCISDIKKGYLDWSFVRRKVESPCFKTSLSMLDSFQETEAVSVTDKERPERLFSFTQPWAPTGVRQRSFVKIRTPAPVSGNTCRILDY